MSRYGNLVHAQRGRTAKSVCTGLLAGAWLIAAPLAAQPPDPRFGPDYLANELLVVFDERAVPAAADPASLPVAEIESLNERLRERAEQLAGARGWSLLDTSPVLRLALFGLPNGVDALAAANSLDHTPGVRVAEPNYLGRQLGTVPPNDSFTGYGAQSGADRLMGAERGWDTIPLDFNVRVAVLDSGFVYEHDDAPLHVLGAGSAVAVSDHDRDFVSAGASLFFYPGCDGSWYPRTWDFSGYDSDASQPMSLDWDYSGPAPCVLASSVGSHGSFVTGIIASAWADVPYQADGTGLIGRAELGPDNSRVEIIPVQVIAAAGEVTNFDLIQGLTYAAGLPASNGSGGLVFMPRAHIANMSLAFDNLSVIQLMAVQTAFARDLLMVAGSGNDNTYGVSFPAAFGEVIAVSAIDTSEARWDDGPGLGSNYGPQVELTAPGAGIYSIAWDFTGCPMAPGVPCSAAFGGVSAYASGDGTSFSSPQVAAMAALYKAHDDSLNASQLRQLLRLNAVDWGAPGRDDEFGLGLVQTAPGSGVTLVNNRTPARVYLIDAGSGEVLQSTDTVADFYQFFNVPPGSYHLLAAVDDDGDGRFGETGEAIGAQGGTAQSPGTIGLSLPGTVQGLVNTVGFTLDWPDQEPEPGNNTPILPGTLFVGFYAEVNHDNLGDEDWFVVRLPDDGLYRFWTEGRNSVDCREDLQDMTPALALLDYVGTLIDEDLGSTTGSRRCAEVVQQLTAGTYYLRLESATGVTPTGGKTILHADRILP